MPHGAVEWRVRMIEFTGLDPDLADKIGEKYSRRWHVEIEYNMNLGVSTVRVSTSHEPVRAEIEEMIKEFKGEPG